MKRKPFRKRYDRLNFKLGFASERYDDETRQYLTARSEASLKSRAPAVSVGDGPHTDNEATKET